VNEEALEHVQAAEQELEAAKETADDGNLPESGARSVTVEPHDLSRGRMSVRGDGFNSSVKRVPVL
jgi:hypothetical protein